MLQFLFILLLICSGCMVGPKYTEPEMALPATFEEERGEIEGDVSQWWKQFNDPVLDALIAEAYTANYDVRIAVEKIEQTRAQYRIERSHLWPEIDLNATATRTKISKNLFPSPPETAEGIPGGSFLPGFLNIFQVGFDALWELDFFGKFRHEKRAAHYLWEASLEDAQDVMIAMLSEVAVHYMTIRALQQKVRLAQETVRAGEEELAIAESLFEVGLDNEMQVTRRISALESDRAVLPVLETSLKQTIYALGVLLGRAPEGLMEIFEEVRPVPVSGGRVPVGLPADLLRRRPDVRSAERQLAAATEQIGAAVADYFPHIALTGINFGAGNRLGSSAGLESSRLSRLLQSASQMFSVGLGLNWNLLDFGRVRGQVDVQNSLQRQALLNYEQTVIGSLKDVESALVAYFEEQIRQAALLQKVEAERRTLAIMRDLCVVGLANEMEVLAVLKRTLSAESSLVESEQALASDLVALYKALGGNWEGSAELPEEPSCS